MNTRFLVPPVVLGAILSVTQGFQLTKTQKDALLSRKEWYLTYEFTRSGSGGADGTRWRVDEHSSGMMELNFAVPGAFSPVNIPTQSSVLQPGRYIGWMAEPTEEAQKAAEAGIQDPAQLPGLYFPSQRSTDDHYETREPDGTNTDNFRGAGTGYAAGQCHLYLDLAEGMYDVVFQVGQTDFGSKVTHDWHRKDNDGTEEWPSPGSLSGWFAEEFIPQLSRRKLSQDMKADGTISFSFDANITDDVWSSGPQKLHVTASFRFSPSPPSTAKLYIEPLDSSKYNKWRPRPGRTEDDPGTTLDVKYTVEEPGVPADKQTTINKVTLRLVNVSKYPGVCMNWPIAPSGPPKFDLRFKPKVDSGTADYTLGEDNQSIRVMGAGDNKTPRTDTMTVECFDGAAIGDLIAEAEMEDGRILTAELRGQSSSKKLLIPDREDGVSDIAKYWKNKYASGQKDDDDKEGDPEGDGQPGDGLTLWEEYRGLRQGNVWRDNCEPKKKDLFIDNRVRARGKAGIGLFARATGLAVHDSLEQGEYQQDRVINFNKRADRHLVDQHCLVLRISSDPNAGTAQGQFGAIFPGPPKNTLWVNVVLGMAADHVFRTATPGVLSVGNEDACMIAHELGHGIGMYHHGEKDPWTNGVFGVLWTLATNNSGGQILEGGAPVHVVSEPAATSYAPTQVIAPPESQRLAQIGFQNGQHSGDWDCIMRYHVANFFELTREQRGRVWKSSYQVPGTKFCTSPAGTEFNTSSNVPNAEFGDADTSKSRGNCIHQFVISDRWQARDRR